MVDVRAPGGTGALLFLVSNMGDILETFMTDWDWPEVLSRSSVDRPWEHTHEKMCIRTISNEFYLHLFQIFIIVQNIECP